MFTSPAETVNQYLSDVAGFLERIKSMNTTQKVGFLFVVVGINKVIWNKTI